MYERVVVNFLQNALKYSPAASPIVVLSSTVTLPDHGPGLSSDESSFVFEKYRRTASARPKEGLGLGLYISRRIVEALGDFIGVDSISGKGATFYSLCLSPAGRPPASRSLAQTATKPFRSCQESSYCSSMTRFTRFSHLTTLLTDEGIIVLSATSGQEALELARAQRPDVAVLDVQMPGMSGITLVERLHDLHPSCQSSSCPATWRAIPASPRCVERPELATSQSRSTSTS